MLIFRQKQAHIERRGDEQRVSLMGSRVKSIITQMPPRHRQNAHMHKLFTEIMWVMKGSVEVFEWCESKMEAKTAHEGDMVVFEPGFFHNMVNDTDECATLHTIKVILAAKPKGLAFVSLLDKDWYGTDGNAAKHATKP